jgi:hypothetical protein
MPVKFRCPECGKLIAVPSKMVGSTINCPHNGCLVEVRAEQVESSHIMAAGNGRSTHSAVPVKLTEETETAVNPATSTAPAQPSHWLRRNVARFIPGGGSPSAAALASDGRLPELKLQEGKARRAPGEAEATNPLVMAGVLCLSFVMSTALVLIDFESPNAGASDRAQARQRLAEFYQQSNGPLEPYQQYLRDAQRAHSRGDNAMERQRYRRVLQLLRAEGRSRYSSVTRSPSGDRELEQLLATLMSEE